MKPYLAIIWDSFYQAFVSWLLWIVLGAIVLVLAVFGGLTYRNELNTQLRPDDVSDWRQLAQHLVEENKQSRPTPGKHIYGMLSHEMQEAVDILARPPESADEVRKSFYLVYRLSLEISSLLANDRFFDAAAFARAKVSTEGRELIAKNNLTPAEVARRNRLLLEGAYPELINASPRYGVQFYYLYFFKFDKPMPLRPEQLVDAVSLMVTGMLIACVSIVGIMVAIVLTSWQIPFMFEEGSIVVLLSKPISRSLMFLAKYLGACAFTLITTACFVLGLFVIVGLQFGIWLPNMLWSIPVFLFVFAIYYSVSAVCGLVARSTTFGTIASIAGVFIFWAFCFGLWYTKSTLDSAYIRPNRIVKLVPAGQRLFAATESGQVEQWNEFTANWEEILVNNQTPAAMPFDFRPQRHPLLGPAYDAKQKALVALPLPARGFGFMMGEQTFAVGYEDQNFRYTQGVAGPPGPLGLFTDRDGSVLVATHNGAVRLNEMQPTDVKRKSSWLNLLVPGSGHKGPLEPLGPEGLFLRDPAAVALNQDTGELATYSAGTLQVFQRTAAGKFERRQELMLPGDPLPGLVAFGGNTIVLALSDGSLNTYAADTLTAGSHWEPEEKNKPQMLAAAPGGAWFAVLYHNGRLWCLDREADELVQPAVRGQGDLSSVAFSSAGKLFVADRSTRVAAYDLGAVAREQEFSPPLSVMESAYYYAVLPAYYVLPKPGELNYTANYLLTRKQSLSGPARPNDPAGGSEETYDPWAPILPGAAFIVVMLAYGCWKIERMEF